MIAKIIFPLPYYIPISTKNAFTLGPDLTIDVEKGESFYSFLNYYKDYGIKEKQDNTIFIITININKDILTDEETRELISDTLVKVNKLIASLRALLDIVHLEPITLTKLPGVIPIILGDKEQGYITNPQQIYIDNNFYIEDEKVGEAIDIINDWDDIRGIRYPNEFFWQAKTDLINGKFNNAIINLQTSFEIYINKVLRNLYVKNNLSSIVIEKHIENVPFINKITQHLKKYLIPDFDVNTSDYFRNWKTYLYDIRNLIIHTGYQVEAKDQAYFALKAYCEIYNTINEKLFEAKIHNNIHPIGFGSLQRPSDFNAFTEKINKYFLKEDV